MKSIVNNFDNEIAREFLVDIRKEFRREDKKLIKIAELRKLE